MYRDVILHILSPSASSQGHPTPDILSKTMQKLVIMKFCQPKSPAGSKLRVEGFFLELVHLDSILTRDMGAGIYV